MEKKEKQLELWNTAISSNYTALQKKLYKWAANLGIEYSEDVFNDTYIRIVDKIKKDGIKAQTKQEYLNYFFKSFKNNLYQHNQQEVKRLDLNLNLDNETPEIAEETETNNSFSIFAKNFIEEKIKENFSTLDYAIFRIRFLITIDNKELNYKQIKQLTGVKDVRKRLVSMNTFIRQYYPKEIIWKEYKQYLNNI